MTLYADSRQELPSARAPICSEVAIQRDSKIASPAPRFLSLSPVSPSHTSPRDHCDHSSARVFFFKPKALRYSLIAMALGGVMLRFGG